MGSAWVFGWWAAVSLSLFPAHRRGEVFRGRCEDPFPPTLELFGVTRAFPGVHGGLTRACVSSGVGRRTEHTSS